MTDDNPFTRSHRENARAAEKQAEKDAVAQAKQATAKQMLDRMKPVFDDLPPYKPRDPFRFGLF